MFYSRSENQYGEKEEVKDHLNRVAALAKANAVPCKMEYEAEIAGLLHDFGKYSELFQKVLEGKAQRVNHEAAGAAIAMNVYKKAVHPVSCAIFGHHKGLEYEIKKYLAQSLNSEEAEDKNNRQYALSGAKAYQEAFKIFKEEVSLPSKGIPEHKYEYCNNKELIEMLRIRMLFSCLVDADYSASAEHFNPNYLLDSSNGPLEAEKILDNLLAYRQTLIEGSAANKVINTIRNEVFDACKKAGEQSPGFYTLTAPTGTGKTLALLAFALQHAIQNKKRRIILVLPFLSIIEQNSKIYKKICGNILEAHSQSKYDEASKELSERWAAPVILTTSVKFFESLFQDKGTRCRKLHQIAESVIIFDEAQTLPSHLIGVTIESLQALCAAYGSTVLFSTATQPDFSFREDIAWNPTEIIPNPQDMYNKTNRVKVDWRINERTPLEVIAEEMVQETSCCAIVNMKKHCLKLFQLLQNRCDGESESVFHISTDMCTSHRIKTLQEIQKRLDNQLPCRIVSTQCIEAGVDLDVQKIYRALGPLEAIIQSAGRCNRNGKDPYGEVVVFIPDEENLYPGPDKHYKFAAEKVKTLYSRYPIELHSLSHIRDYYQLVFEEVQEDSSSLLGAIADKDFEKVQKEYKLIKQDGCMVIVPYHQEKALYEEIKEEALKKGMTPELMKKAAPIVVSSYNIEKVQEIAEYLHYFNRGRKVDSNWYLLGDTDLYNKDTGLQLEKDTSLNTIF